MRSFRCLSAVKIVSDLLLLAIGRSWELAARGLSRGSAGDTRMSSPDPSGYQTPGSEPPRGFSHYNFAAFLGPASDYGP